MIDGSGAVKRYAPKDGPVEAIGLKEDNLKAAAGWCGGEVIEEQVDNLFRRVLLVPSIEGGLRALVGEYLVKEGNRFRVESANQFLSKYKQVGQRQDGFQPAKGTLINRTASHASEAGAFYDDALI